MISHMCCPHCGKIVTLDKDGLVPWHYDIDLPLIRVNCSGSKQNPRCAESDRRVLWNGKSNPHAE